MNPRNLIACICLLLPWLPARPQERPFSPRSAAHAPPAPAQRAQKPSPDGARPVLERMLYGLAQQKGTKMAASQVKALFSYLTDPTDTASVPYTLDGRAHLPANPECGGTAGTRLFAHYYAKIIVEVPVLRPTPEQRQALYTTWPSDGLAGQRPRRAGQDYGTIAVFAWD